MRSIFPTPMKRHPAAIWTWSEQESCCTQPPRSFRSFLFLKTYFMVMHLRELWHLRFVYWLLENMHIQSRTSVGCCIKKCCCCFLKIWPASALSCENIFNNTAMKEERKEHRHPHSASLHFQLCSIRKKLWLHHHHHHHPVRLVNPLFFSIFCISTKSPRAAKGFNLQHQLRYGFKDNRLHYFTQHFHAGWKHITRLHFVWQSLLSRQPRLNDMMCTAATRVSPPISMRPLSARPTCLVFGGEKLTYEAFHLFTRWLCCSSAALWNCSAAALEKKNKSLWLVGSSCMHACIYRSVHTHTLCNTLPRFFKCVFLPHTRLHTHTASAHSEL